MKAQIINKDGKPEWAVLPFRDYRKMMEALEDLADAKAIAVDVDDLLPD